MKKLILLLAICASFMAGAQEKARIALLTSLDPKDGKAFYNLPGYDNNQKIEKEFRKHFDTTSFEIVVTHRATLGDVWSTLHDPKVTAVFFVGHAGEETEFGNNHSLSAPAIIADENLNDLKNAFQKVHPNLKYLAVISCNSKSIIDTFIKDNSYSNAPDLVIKTFDHKVRPLTGLKESIKDAINLIAKDETYDDVFPFRGPCGDYGDEYLGKDACIKYALENRKLKANPNLFRNNLNDNDRNSNKLTIKRNIPQDTNEEYVRASLILMNNHVVGFFPKGTPGEEQTIEIDLPDTTSDSPIKLINDSGLNSKIDKSKIFLGELEIVSDNNNCTLKGEKNRRGELLGVGKNYYKFICNH